MNSDLRLQVGIFAPNRLFVHAGVVGWQGQAIVIPGRSFSGKTTLTAALVQAGASYYSDEYIVFDPKGFVHSYPRPLSIRYQVGEQIKKKNLPVEDLGGKVGKKALPVGLIVFTNYEIGARWDPQIISLGKVVLELLDNTIVARSRSKFALSILPRTVVGALMLKGKRGDALKVAATLLKTL